MVPNISEFDFKFDQVYLNDFVDICKNKGFVFDDRKNGEYFIKLPMYGSVTDSLVGFYAKKEVGPDVGDFVVRFFDFSNSSSYQIEKISDLIKDVKDINK
ncbi:hypothetical protein K9L67_03535 [Candidatus Woesearchaeota archaeon]|nr:hypothetical protein [Candidatus Woesearchaeota archaeon]MCF7901274.1 hypothetical protein [Candidatus Woesearchaeota archaeon]MCF8013559.1 hypothetical protein [Candidatus Woesearchaeota archaeon]